MNNNNINIDFDYMYSTIKLRGPPPLVGQNEKAPTVFNKHLTNETT